MTDTYTKIDDTHLKVTNEVIIEKENLLRDKAHFEAMLADINKLLEKLN